MSRNSTLRRRARTAFGVLCLVFVGTGCGSESPSSALVTVSPKQDLDLTSQPELTGSPVFTISGMGVDARFTDGLALDIASLERLRVVETAIVDPWEKRSVTYRGVLMSDLLEAVAPTGATMLRMIALDDYVVTLSMEELRSGDVMLATSADGARLEIEAGGPTKIVFLSGSAMAGNADMWIWSVKEMVAQ